MSEVATAGTLRQPNVAESANQCMRSFQECLLQAAEVHPRELSLVEDQLARFSVWTASNRVFAEARVAMDHRLRAAPEAQGVVTGLLEALDYGVQSCSVALQNLRKLPQGSVLTAPGEHFEQLLGQVSAEISRLHKISNTIRQASAESQNRKASSYRIKDEENNDLEPALLQCFQHYLSDRFPNLSCSIGDRLARTMVLRRKRILYRRSRWNGNRTTPAKPPASASVTVPKTLGPQPDPVHEDPAPSPTAPTAIVESVMPSYIKSATTLSPEKFHLVFSAPSIVSKTKTVSLGKHDAQIFPPPPWSIAARNYARKRAQRQAEHVAHLESLSALARDTIPMNRNAISRLEEQISAAEAKLQEALDSDLDAVGEVDCPYCLCALPIDVIIHEQKWRKHVKTDLDPYVCLFEECDQQDELYSHGEEWIKHMQTHNLQWLCRSHRDRSFRAREEYIDHMRKDHRTSLDNPRLELLADRNSRRGGKLFASCPLCGEEEADEQLEDHITDHLRALALKSLPIYQENIPDGSGGEENSLGVSRPLSRSTIRDFNDQLGQSGDASPIHWEEPPPAARDMVDGHAVQLLDGELEFLSKNVDWELYHTSRSFPVLAGDEIIESMLKWKAEEVAKERYRQPETRGSDTIEDALGRLVSEKHSQEHYFDTPRKDYGIEEAQYDFERAIEESTRLYRPSEYKSRVVFGADFQTSTTSQEATGGDEEYQVQKIQPRAEESPGLPRNQVHSDNESRQADGDEFEYEQGLDSRFCIHPSSRFRPGTVLKALWSEPAGPGNDDSKTYLFGCPFYICIRRFVVVANDEGHCTCVPILTYEGKGCTKQGVKPLKHGMVYPAGEQPRRLEGEPKLGFKPVCIDLIPGEKLASQSRINYSKLVTVDHSWKVFFIGDVQAKDFAAIVTPAVDQCWGEKRHRPRGRGSKS